MVNSSAYIVEEYFNMKMLSKLGYQFDGSIISSSQVEAYGVIESTINKEREKMDKAAANKSKARNKR